MSTTVPPPAEAWPLHWPEGWERTPPGERERSRFEVTEVWARTHLLEQIRLLGGRGVVLSTNVTLRRDGLPYANQKTPEDPGVACYWLTRKNEWRVVACDKWRTVWENIRAIGLTLEALRGLERWGASGILDRAFQGFKVLPGAGDELAPQHWRQVLGVEPTASLADAEAAYRRLAREHHPDRGGDAAVMATINAAIAQARRELGRG